MFKNSKIHKNFRLNGVYFSNSKDLVVYSQTIAIEYSDFLKEWFSKKSFIVVKTSGSTGKPKMIRLQKEHVLNSALTTGSYFQLNSKTSALLCLPISFIAGKMMLIRALVLGWHLDIVAPSSNPLEKVTKQYDFSAMVPLQVKKSLLKLHNIKKLIVGGGVVPYTLQKKLALLSTKIYATYGMTETITHIAIKPLNHIENKPNFYKVLPNVSIYKDKRNCLVIKAGRVSKEIVFTNDVVALVSDNQFDWLGRHDNVINSGGVKLYPEKIEEKFSKVISKRFFVAGVKDSSLGEKLILVIEGEKHMIDFCENMKLSKFETPKEIYFVKRFIETDTGKIQRKKTLMIIKDRNNRNNSF